MIRKTKRCTRCRKRKKTCLFSKRHASPDGVHLVCKECDCARLKRWRRKHPNAGKEWFAAHPGYKEERLKKDPLMHRRHHLGYAYGMSLEDFSSLFKRQGKRCAICRRKDFQPVVDHNHRTGKVRGILCYPCNSALGFLADSARKIKAALEYIEHHS